MSASSYQDNVGQLFKNLKKISLKYQRVVFSSSLGAEDMVITDAIAKHAPDIEIITLDTGRLHEQTYKLLEQIQQAYEHRIKVYYPDQDRLSRYVNTHGVNAFYHSVENRKACCEIRKIEPLKRALTGADAWVTGIRRSQSVTRDNMAMTQWDDAFGVQKVNPMLDWSEDDVWRYIRENEVPYNELHDQHFPSIGCSPCTRPIAVGEDIRAGRWWWEDPATKECGLHAIPIKNINAKQA